MHLKLDRYWFYRKTHSVFGQADPRNTGDCNRQVFSHLARDDETTARSVSEVLIDPAHVIKELPERLAPALRELQFNDDVLSFSIDGQQVDTAGIDWKLDALTLRGSMEPQARLDTLEILGKEIAKVRLKCKLESLLRI